MRGSILWIIKSLSITRLSTDYFSMGKCLFWTFKYHQVWNKSQFSKVKINFSLCCHILRHIVFMGLKTWSASANSCAIPTVHFSSFLSVHFKCQSITLGLLTIHFYSVRSSIFHPLAVHSDSIIFMKLIMIFQLSKFMSKMVEYIAWHSIERK